VHGSLLAFAEEFVASSAQAGAVLTRVPDPRPFGVAELRDGELVGFEEKPVVPKSDLVPIGVYFFRPPAFAVIHGLRPSGRGEFEITDVLNAFIADGTLVHHVFEGEWQDAGTIQTLLRAGSFAAEFASELPREVGHSPEEVEAERVDAGEVSP
jgi:glucose-1-phosphate thymidylyltransferase